MAASKKPKLMEAGHPDNFQTPAYALDSLLPYFNRSWSIWEPSCGKGNLVRGLQAKDYDATGTDLLTGTDFLSSKVDRDAIITNPPFSIKKKFLSRCYNLGKPFALLLPMSTFDSIGRRELMHRYGIQVILPNRRINFETPNGKGSTSWFYTAWFTHGLNLPSQIVFDGMRPELL